MENMNNYPKIIPVYHSYLEHWQKAIFWQTVVLESSKRLRTVWQRLNMTDSFSRKPKLVDYAQGGDRGHFVTKCGQARCIVMVNTF